MSAAIPGATVRATVRPSVGPRLRVVLWMVFVLVALLGANSVYLVSLTSLNALTSYEYKNWFYPWMFLAHVVLGVLLVAPFVVFLVGHMANTRFRKNKRAIRVGYGLTVASVVVLVTGFLLFRLPGAFELKSAVGRSVVYWLHVVTPLVCVWLYVLHRLVGPKIRWQWGLGYAGAVAAGVGGMLLLHNQDPRRWNEAGPKEGEKYFFPSLARTETGKFIPEHALDNDEYCLKCHQDAYQGWFHSSHRFSSFNNPMYLASVRETREVMLKRDGNVQGARFCAGCHDPVPFFTGAFDDPKFDDVNHSSAQDGITCTTCHSIVHVNSSRGNADFTIEEPEQYPFAYSDNAILQWVNHQLIKAKPELHKRTYLKDFHKSAEFCSTCHKVHLPYALNHYKEFLRGQNHYDSYHLSGVSGHGARSFYYPPKAQENCNGCHMPLKPSDDFGAQVFAGAKERSIHGHLFPAANTGLPWLRKDLDAVKAHHDFLQGIVRVDVFGLKAGGEIDGKLTAPLRPNVPELVPGEKYLLETVIRTLKLGHPLTQGTVDSNELWLEATVTSGDRVIGRIGAMDAEREVDPWAHFVNVFMLDKDGNRIDRRNAQDIFVPLYNNQIPPGAGQTVHLGLELPSDITEPVKVEVKLQYRKFDKQYMDFVTKAARPGDLPIGDHVAGESYVNDMPVTTMASDTVVLPLAGRNHRVENAARDIPEWQRWNDYGIGLLLKGKVELRQAEEAFTAVEGLKRFDGPLNLARVYFAEGRLDDATAALKRALAHTDPPPYPWTAAWLGGLVAREQGDLSAAEQNFRKVLEERTPEMIERGFDFSQDYEVLNLLGQTLFEQAKRLRTASLTERRDEMLRQAAEQFRRTLELDSENVTAHYELSLIYSLLGQEGPASEHRQAHARYKTDDNARDRAFAIARKKYPAANHAAEPVVIYSLQRPGAPGLTQRDGGLLDVAGSAVENEAK